MLHFRRNFSTSRAAQVDLSNLYSKLTSWRRKTPATPVVDPTAKSEKEVSDEGVSSGAKPRKLQVIGQPPKVEDSWPEVKEFAEFTPFPTNHYKRDLQASDIDRVFSELSLSESLGSIQQKFDSFKAVSQKLKIAIPDPVLTQVNTISELKDYLIEHSRAFDERQPDAIYLDQKDFIGTNVTIEDPVAERKAEKKRLNELVSKARQARKQAADELMR